MPFELNDRTRKHSKNRDVLLISCMLGLLSAFFAPSANAGIFSVAPVRVYMASHERAAAITVTNDGDDDLVMQTDIYEWKQTPDGKELLTLSEDMIMAPPILKMVPRSHQVIRLISLNEKSRDQQSTYRMLVREIPEARRARADLQVQIAYAFSIPIFITPPGALAKVDCVLTRLGSDAVQAVCQNSGSAAAHITGLHISNSAQETVTSINTGAYILPGVHRSFDLRSKEGAIPAGNFQLVVVMSDGTSQNYDTVLGK